MGNRSVVEAYFDAFGRADHDAIVACLAADVVWSIPGFFRITGQAVIDAHRPGREFIGDPDVVLSRVVEDGDVVVVEGVVRHERVVGPLHHVAFCDVFVVRNGLITELTSYLIEQPAR